MSWSIEIYSRRPARLTTEELARGMNDAAPSLELCDGTAAESWALCDPQTGERFCLIQAASFEEESETDPELVSLLEQEIADSDADDGAIDEAYTGELKDALRNARWHYTISAARDTPDAETATVRAAYGVAAVANGLVHDLQSGAWMDASLFEEMLDAYGASLPF